MHILVTGAAGFIGSRISELLLAQGHTVVGMDNLNTAYDVRLKEWRRARLQAQEGFTFYPGDITDREALMHAAGPRPFDSVCNLAARAGVPQSLQTPAAYYQTNVLGNLALLEACREWGVRKFLLASTSSVYGDGERPFREDAPTDRPKSPYAASKKAAEVMTYAFHRLYGIDATVVRFFTVYGPAGRPDMSIFRFIRWIAEGEPLLLNGDGTQERDFTFVDDTARGTVAALELSGFHIINLGSDHPVPLNDAIRLTEGALGRKAQITRHPLHPSDVPGTWADVSQARELLGWSPQVALEEGIHRTVEWYLEHRSWVRELALE